MSASTFFQIPGRMTQVKLEQIASFDFVAATLAPQGPLETAKQIWVLLIGIPFHSPMQIQFELEEVGRHAYNELAKAMSIQVIEPVKAPSPLI